MAHAGHISFRVIRNEDRDFLYRVFAGDRAPLFEIAFVGEADRQDLLRQQFEWQDLHYRQHHADASYRIVMLDGVDVGRLYSDRKDDELRVLDLSLLPAYRGRGIGTTILAALMKEAENGRVPVRLHVEAASPALGFYERLGFRRVRLINGAHFLMEWLPPAEAFGPAWV